ncbi:MAG: hypothetical protein ACREDU_01265, partial [Methylocella sp.]
LQAAPALNSLETRLNELASRVQRSESTAASSAQEELRAIESRILGLLNEAQAASGNQASSSDLQRLYGEIGNLNQRVEEAQADAASERDVDALRTAVEQLSARVAQSPDMRPLTEMDRRLGELAHKLDQTQALTRNQPQLSELEHRIAELDHRLAEAQRPQEGGPAVAALEQQLIAVNDRIGRAEQQLGHFDTIERAITQLFESLEQNRGLAREAAEEAANRVAERVLAGQSPASGPSPEMQALEEGLRAVRESAQSSDQRNQETLEAVHETLEQIVNKLAELETAAAGHQLALNMAQQPDVAQMPPQPQFFENPTPVFQETGSAAPEATAGAFTAPPIESPPQRIDFSMGASEQQDTGDDFIAAARRAAKAAATHTSVLPPEIKLTLKSGANRRFGFPRPFRKRAKPSLRPEPMNFSGGKPPPAIQPAVSNDNKRRTLLLAGLVLLMAVSAFTVNMIRSAKPPPQSSAIELTVNRLAVAQTADGATEKQDQAVVLPKSTGDGSILSWPDKGVAQSPSATTGMVLSDGILTGALPVKKTDASLTSIVAEPGTSAEQADEPPSAIGSASLREAAARGDATAQFIVASRYLDGQNVAQDFTKAAYWYQEAASRGLAPAQYRIATLFERGKGVPQDVAAALLWYERAADAGNVKSMHNAAVIAAGDQAGTPNY